MIKGVAEYESPFGKLQCLENDAPVSEALKIYGEWAGQEVDFILQLLKEGDTIIEVGAFLGTHAIPFAKKVGASGKVICFEPNPRSFALLQENIKRSQCYHVEAVNKFVSNEKGQRFFENVTYVQSINVGASQGKSVSSGLFTQPIETVRLGDLPFSKVNFIKVDAEGAGIEVLEGAKNLVEKFRPQIYVECNTVDEANELYLFAKKLKMHAYYCEFSSYRPNNFLNETENIFGEAKESALLLSFDRLAITHDGVSSVEDLDELKRKFLNTTRWGDSSQTLTTLEILEHQKNSLPKFSSPSTTLDRPLTFIVPIYNGFEKFLNLIRSLKSTYPQPRTNLDFLFYDDASTDRELLEFLKSDSFFNRSDVRLIFGPKNLGFVGAVNTSTAMVKNDFVLLNSDTEVWVPIDGPLQQLAYLKNEIASVTPYSNNATVASFFQNPIGTSSPSFLNLEFLSKALFSLPSSRPYFEVPSGVGFCLYIKKAVWDSIGAFDEAFAPGYGEENDWCLRAKKKGFLNVVAPNVFVMHNSGVSFGSERRKRLIDDHYLMLLSRYPSYQREVDAVHDNEDFRFDRLNKLIEILKISVPEKLRFETFILHKDSLFPLGGTERHVKRKICDAMRRGSLVFEIFPENKSQKRLRVWFRSEILFDERFSSDNFAHILSILENNSADLEFHHAIGFSADDLELIAKTGFQQKVCYIHDYYFVTPSIQFLRPPYLPKFCEVEPNLDRCNTCARNNFGVKKSIQEYRKNSISFLNAFDEVIFPAPAARHYFEKALSVAGVDYIPKTWKVLSHNLDIYRHASPNILEKPVDENTIVFLGAFGPHKGLILFLRSLFYFKKAKKKVLLLGHSRLRKLIEKFGLAEIILYKNEFDLKRRLAQLRPSAIIMPAIWPETFSYVFYEAIYFSPIESVLIVGPYGNPAEMVDRWNCGIKMKAPTFKGLIEAVQSVSNSRLVAKAGRIRLRMHLDEQSFVPSQNRDSRNSGTFSLHDRAPLRATTREPLIKNLKYYVGRVNIAVRIYALLKLARLRLRN